MLRNEGCSLNSIPIRSTCCCHDGPDHRSRYPLGIELSLDDFGAGYSSLSYLKRFPIDKLKIDQSFGHDVSADADDETMVSATIVMAHQLQIRLVAEGVETEAQLAFLRDRGCDEYQGYHFSRPLPADQLYAGLLGTI